MNEALIKFNELNEDQFRYGGIKYSSSNEKEATDCLFDVYGFKWLIGTVHKYIYRTKNLARERDLLKIACYQFIIWLKRGYHLNQLGSEIPINTTVKVKTESFSKFSEYISNYYTLNENYLQSYLDEGEALSRISEILENMADFNWLDITEETLLEIYCLSFIYWNNKYYKTNTAGNDTDTFNEKKGFKEN